VGQTINLKNHFLLAMPQLNDPWFANSVCYICDHNEEGSMGLVINKPLNMKLTEILKELEIEASQTKNQLVLQGGPVSPEQGFILYHGAVKTEQNMAIAPNINLTTSKEILEEIGTGQGPENMLICLGYAGWEAGQLEAEITANSWLTIPADDELLFHTPSQEVARAAAKKLGIDINLLSGQSGHA